MADISKIKVNNTTYNVRDNSQLHSLHNHITSEIEPIATKTYSNYTVSANDGNAGVIYFGTVTLNNTSNYYAPYWIHYTLEVTTSEAATQGYYDVYWGQAGGTVSYHIFNNFYSGSYYPIYHHRILWPKSGYSAQGAHLGIRVQSARNPTTLARTYKINILETYGCTVTFKDSLATHASLYNSTYFNSTDYSGTAVGLQETGDTDTTGRDYSHSGYLVNGSQFRLQAYSLFGLDSNGNAQGISLNSTDHITATNSISTTRVYNPAGIDWTRGLWYTNSGTNFAKNAAMNISPAPVFYNFDLRYADNCVAASTTNTLGIIPRKPIYFRGYIKKDGLFYIDPISVTYNNAVYKRAWTQDAPTDYTYYVDPNDNLVTYQHVFWLIGQPYYNGSYPNSGYQVNLFQENKMYWYQEDELQNGMFVEYRPTLEYIETIYNMLNSFGLNTQHTLNLEPAITDSAQTNHAVVQLTVR